MNRSEYDVIIIGGGINGIGIARDCALRGMKPLLIEKHDFAKGASGNNTGMIHGGIRYLRYDVHTTKVSCTDSGYIQKIAPHLLFRVPFIYPVMKGQAGGKWLLEGAEIFFEAYDAFQPLKRGKSHTRLTREEALTLEPGLTPDIIGAVTMDEWGIDAYRLTLANALDAAEHGADVRTNCMLTQFHRDSNQRIVGVQFFDKVTKEEHTHYAPVIVNACGAWGPSVAALANVHYRLRPGKGVHIVFSHRVSNYGIVMHAVDDRQMFFLPHENSTIIGTTDDDFYGDLDNPKVLEDEVKYIMESARHVFPSIDSYRKSHTYVGVRPTIYEWGKPSDGLSREHQLIDHARDGAAGLYSVTGGKLAAYRQLAEEMTDVIAQVNRNKNACITHEKSLPGGNGSFDTALAAKKLQMHALTIARAAYRHGSRTEQISDLVKENPKFQAETCICEPVCEAEIRYSIRCEKVRHLTDLQGRNRLAYGACGGTHCWWRASQVFAQERKANAPTELQELEEALEMSFSARKAALDGANLATQEISHAAYFLTANLRPFFRLARRADGETFRS